MGKYFIIKKKYSNKYNTQFTIFFLKLIINSLNSKKSPKQYSFLNGNKIKLNIIYLDENINGFEDFSASYEFFKLLKNSIDGVFFGIKNEEDFHFIKVQLPEEFKFILIYASNDKYKAKEFLESYHSMFSDILIFTIDENEFDNLGV